MADGQGRVCMLVLLSATPAPTAARWMARSCWSPSTATAYAASTSSSAIPRPWLRSGPDPARERITGAGSGHSRILSRAALAHPARPGQRRHRRHSGDAPQLPSHRIRPSGPGTPRSLGRSSGLPRPPRSVLKRFFRTVHGSSHHSRWLGSPVGRARRRVRCRGGVRARRAELIAAQDGDWGAARRPGDVGPLGSRAPRYRRRPARPGGGGERAQGRCRRRFRGGGCRAAPGRG